jgi:hypothetical protein
LAGKPEPAEGLRFHQGVSSISALLTTDSMSD